MNEPVWHHGESPLADPRALANAAAEVVHYLNAHMDDLVSDESAIAAASDFFGVQPAAGRYIAAAMREHSMEEGVEVAWLGPQADKVMPDFNVGEAFDSAFSLGFLVAMRYHRNLVGCASS